MTITDGFLFASILGNYLFAIALFLVIVAIFIWATAIRKPGRKHLNHGRHHWHMPKETKAPDEKSARTRRGWFGLGKRPKRRRKERPRNPTLAETGGLPAVRRDDPEIPPTV